MLCNLQNILQYLGAVKVSILGGVLGYFLVTTIRFIFKEEA